MYCCLFDQNEVLLLVKIYKILKMTFTIEIKTDNVI